MNLERLSVLRLKHSLLAFKSRLAPPIGIHGLFIARRRSETRGEMGARTCSCIQMGGARRDLNPRELCLNLQTAQTSVFIDIGVLHDLRNFQSNRSIAFVQRREHEV